MDPLLDIHAASPDEVAAAHRSVFDIWSKGLAIDEHVRARLESPKHRLATWYVGVLDGRVVVSLGAYPLRFRLCGEEVPGFAIGSVYTVGEFRRRGLAARLIDWVERHEHQRGAVLSLLYSDIDPGYYARLGYVLCPSWEGWRELADVRQGTTSAHRLVEFQPHAHLPALMKLYADYHGAGRLFIARPPTYWAALLERFPEERFFALVDHSGAWAGYVRLDRRDAAWRITDFALADPSDELADSLYAAVLDWAHQTGATRAGGWLPASAAARRHFSVVARRQELTMLKTLSPGQVLESDLLADTDRFCEIDHV